MVITLRTKLLLNVFKGEQQFDHLLLFKSFGGV
jgi:hypothetical protein